MQMILLIENISILIEYKNLSITELFNVICDSESYSLLKFLGVIKDGVYEYHETLNKVFIDSRLLNIFDCEDIEFIKGFFSMLGTSDTNGQLVNCSLYKKLFEKKYSQLVSIEKSKCRCTSTISIGLGLVISIFLI